MKVGGIDLGDDLVWLIQHRPAIAALLKANGADGIVDYWRTFSSLEGISALEEDVDNSIGTCTIYTGMHSGVMGTLNPFMSFTTATALGLSSSLWITNSSVSVSNSHLPDSLRIPTSKGNVVVRLLSKSRREWPVYAISSLKVDDVLSNVTAGLRRHGIAATEDKIARAALDILDTCWPDNDSLQFVDQARRFNNALAAQLTPPGRGPSRWETNESFLVSLISGASDQAVATLPDLYALGSRAFGDLPWFSNQSADEGTSFYWYVDRTCAKPRRRAVRWINDEFVVDNGPTFGGDNATIAELIGSGSLMVGGVLKYLMLTFVLGIPILGGHNQIQQIAEIAEALKLHGYASKAPDGLHPTRWIDAGPMMALPSPLEAAVRPELYSARLGKVSHYLHTLSVGEFLSLYAERLRRLQA